jgi:hypothetical protein
MVVRYSLRKGDGRNIQKPEGESRKKSRHSSFVLRHSSFELLSTFGLRASDFSFLEFTLALSIQAYVKKFPSGPKF